MRPILWVLIAAPLFASSAFGWGCEGHQMVALIARMHLTPATSAAVDELLTTNPIDPALKRYCQDRPKDPMADSATWADDVKGPEKTAVWHYVDIPRTVKLPTSLDPWCPPIGPSVDGKDRPGCITKAIEYELTILRDKSKAAGERANALRYIIHFFGDIHQPLHDSDNNDKGGNCVSVTFYDEKPVTNLHSVWDFKLIEHQLEKFGTTQTSYASALDKGFKTRYETLAPQKVNDPDTWAWESFRMAQSVTYGALTPSVPIETPNPNFICDVEKAKTQALNIKIGEEYFSKAIQVIDEQLAVAGYRLAALLNTNLP